MKSKERKSNAEPSADSGLDLETKFFSRSAQRRSFSVDIPSYLSQGETESLRATFKIETRSDTSSRTGGPAQAKQVGFCSPICMTKEPTFTSASRKECAVHEIGA